MTFNFKYKSVPLRSGKTILRPMIPLTLRGKENIDVIGILDSGSDMTIIPKELAEVLGLEYSGSNEVFGISGNSVCAREAKLMIKFGKGHEVYDISLQVLVPEKEGVAIIIGRLGFFNNFKITFSESERKIEFKKVSDYISY